MFVGVFGMPFCLKPIFVTSGMPVWSCPWNLTCAEPQWPMIVQPGGLRAVRLLGATKEQLVIYPWWSNSPVWYSDLAGGISMLTSTCFIRLGLGLWLGKYENWCTFALSAVITVVHYWIVIIGVDFTVITLIEWTSNISKELYVVHTSLFDFAAYQINQATVDISC